MSEGKGLAWRGYRGAPAVGAVICRLDEVPDPGTRCLRMGGFPVVVARNGAVLRAYVNACPHQFLPLDQRGPQVMSADGTRLRCTNHEAAFRLTDGVGVEGPASGEALDPIPVRVTDAGEVVIAE